MSRRVMVCILIGLLLVVSVSSAASATWTAWLYCRDSGQMVLVDDTGATLDSLQLPTLMGYDTYSYNVAVSHSGTKIAYTVYSSSFFTTQLLVYDTITDQTITTFSPNRIIGDSIDFVGSPYAFNDFDTAFAYGYLPEDDDWQVVVLDLLANAQVFALHANDPLAASANLQQGMLWVPVVRRYQGVDITFTIVATGTEGFPEYPSYIWNPLSGTLGTTVAYPTLNADIFAPTGEVITAAYDDRLPNVLNSLPIPYQLNTIQVYDPATKSRVPFFNGSNLTITQTFFIQNGQRVLVNAFDVNDSTSEDPRFWMVLDRNGAQLASNLPVPRDARNVAGLADGFVHTVSSDLAGSTSTSLVHTQTDNDLYSQRTIWSGTAAGEYRIVWAKDTRTPDVMAQSAGSWTQLADPVFDDIGSGGGISPGAIPSPTPLVSSGVGILTVGGTATINTTDGDPLNVRSGPGTSYAIVVKAQTGTRVNILEGPRNGDGYTWWRIRLPNGQEGWAVESADNVRTLLP